MKRQPNRLPADAAQGFGGTAIDRGQPLAFRLNGRPVEAFAGDTVLSALLAVGIDTVGTYRGEPIGLDERFAPPVALAGDPATGFPMDRLPALAGADYVTLGPRQSRFALGRFAPRLADLFRRRGRSFGHLIDDPRSFEGRWSLAAPFDTVQADLVVVGGGVAGMSAALAAANAGGRVLLVERRPQLGGDATYFGTEGEEKPADAMVASLVERMANFATIRVLTSAEAFTLAGNRLGVHQVEIEDGVPVSRVLRLVSHRIVLATGAGERLPTFPGNRAPRVVGALTAYHRATRYGVWQGRRAVVATPNNAGYRLALLAGDAGVAVQRVADPRPGTQSRFVDFCKASGITLTAGLALKAADPSPRVRDGLQVGFSVTVEGGVGDAAPVVTDLLVAAGNWQPRLALWLMAGGAAQYDAERRRLEARGGLDGVVLAGAAAGYRGTTACARSGERAVALLYRRPAEDVTDPDIDPLYETPAVPAPIAPYRPGRGIAFLDGGLSFTERPPQFKADAPVIAPSRVGTLSLGDVAAAVEIGSLPAAEAGTIAQERCVGATLLGESDWRPPPLPQPVADLPPYLAGRFTGKPQAVVLAAPDGRRFEVGCMVFPNSDTTDPLQAVGVVVAQEDGATGARALIAPAVVASGIALFVRDSSGAVAVGLERAAA